MIRELKKTNLKWIFLIIAFCLSLPSAARADSFTSSELDTLVSAIALYPDPLLVHVLTASTYGDQIPAANAFAQSHKHLTGAPLAEAIEKAEMGYDPSVLALIPFPTVLDMMNKYATWCNQLGEAMNIQKEDVMAAVQRMRHKAVDFGYLKSNNQVTVVVDTVVVIQPAQVEYVYVPVYNPHVVYYTPYHGGVYINYGVGVRLGTWFGEWGWGTCWFDWGYRTIYVRNYNWYYHRHIPHHPRRYVPSHRGFGPPPGYRPAPAPRPAPRMAPAPRPAPKSQMAPAPRPAPKSQVAPAPRPAPKSQVAPAPRPAPQSQMAPAPRPAPQSQMAPAPRPTSHTNNTTSGTRWNASNSKYDDNSRRNDSRGNPGPRPRERRR